MEITDLKNLHYGKPAFCMGTAPHLNKLDLKLLKNHITIGCNQLALKADKLNIDYIYFQRNERFVQVKDKLKHTRHPKFIIPENILLKNKNWDMTKQLKARIIPVHNRFVTPGYAEFFSFNLENCLYSGDSVAGEIQLAAWMGCNPIYILGVDANYTNPEHPFFDDTKLDNGYRQKMEKYYFPDLRNWLLKVKTLLWTKGIKIYNAAGHYSSLDILPKIRLNAATGQPSIAVTSKTFSEDEYLVNELKRYFGNVKLNNCKAKLEGKLLADFLKDADGVILGTEKLDANVISKLPCLRFVSKYGVGVDNIDFDALKRYEIELSHKKGLNSDSVAELTLAFAIMLIRNIGKSITGYQSNNWTKLPGKELAEMTLGIIGYGNVGKVVAEKFAHLGIGRLLVNDLIDFPITPPVEFVPLDYLLSESDIVSLHISMEKQNYHFVDKIFIDKMKTGAYLINTSRGEVLDENAIIKALKTQKLSGAALDVYENEPLINPCMLDCPNILTTCHIAGSSNRAIKNMGWAAIEGLLKAFNMEPL